MACIVDSCVLDVRTQTDPLLVSAKHYTLRSSMYRDESTSAPPFVLLLAHALGFHKEHWEPFLFELAKLIEENPNSGLDGTEAWALDCQDHGESAILNENILSESPRFVSCYDYGRAFVSLLQSSYFSDQKKSCIIFVGHSAGAASAILASTYFATIEQIPFHSLILVEPAMIPQEFVDSDQEAQTVVKRVIQSKISRRDIWPDSMAARKWLQIVLLGALGITASSIYMWQVQHSNDMLVGILLSHDRIMVSGHFRLLFILICGKVVEGSAYDEPKIQYDALARLAQISGQIPVHIILGAKKDYLCVERKTYIDGF
ncbi:hypothetical protein B0H14DRAFT_3150052 [Mycena olivaceomarginata]|nr:hypothetical protein B0H14DRAFT_3150052 [Mycena olivaceomarginata]